MADKDKDDDEKVPAARAPKQKISDAAWNSFKAKFIDLMRVPELTQSTAGWNHLTGKLDEARRLLEDEL
jgi:hypothetical protein